MAGWKRWAFPRQPKYPKQKVITIKTNQSPWSGTEVFKSLHPTLTFFEVVMRIFVRLPHWNHRSYWFSLRHPRSMCGPCMYLQSFQTTAQDGLGHWGNRQIAAISQKANAVSAGLLWRRKTTQSPSWSKYYSHHSRSHIKLCGSCQALYTDTVWLSDVLGFFLIKW